jgi:primosomal protein N' (replication factor Y)
MSRPAAALAATLPADAEVLGPAPLFRLRGRERHVLVVKSERRRTAVRAVGAAVAHAAAARAGQGIAFSVDVDPQ